MKVIKRVFKYFIYLILSLLVFLSLYTVVITKVMHKDYANIFGYTYFIVASGSMSGTIEVNDIIVVKINDEYKVDDIITFKSDDAFITHRVISIDDDRVITRGDVNNIDDEPVNKDAIIGRVSLIVPMTLVFKAVAIILFVVIIYLIVNFDKIFKKYITKEKEHKVKKRETPLEYTQAISVISIKEALEDKLKKVEVEPMNVEEKVFIDLVLGMLKSKKKLLKLTTDGSLKLQYLYTLVVTDFYDPEAVLDLLYNIPFDELYNYDFESISFTKTIQDKLYEMPIHVFFRLLEGSLLYDEIEFFDAVLKVLKYRVRIEKDNRFINDNHHVGGIITSIESTVKNLNCESNFDLEAIKKRIKVNAEIKNLDDLELPMLKKNK